MSTTFARRNMYIISPEDTLEWTPLDPFFHLTLFFPFNLPLPELTHTTLWHFKLAAPVRQNWRFSSPLSTLFTPLFLILLCWVVLGNHSLYLSTIATLLIDATTSTGICHH